MYYPDQDTISYVDKNEDGYRLEWLEGMTEVDRSRKARYSVFSPRTSLERSRNDVYIRDNKFWIDKLSEKTSIL